MRLKRDFMLAGLFSCCLGVVCLIDHLTNSWIQVPLKSLRVLSNGSTIPSCSTKTFEVTFEFVSPNTIYWEDFPTKMASNTATVSWLSNFLLLVNQWISCMTRGSKSCLVTWKSVKCSWMHSKIMRKCVKSRNKELFVFSSWNTFTHFSEKTKKAVVIVYHRKLP